MLKRALKEFWTNLPVWYLHISVTSLTFSYISLTPEPRYDLIKTFIFPYFLFLAFYYARIYTDKTIAEADKSRLFIKLFFWTSVLILIIVVFSSPIRLGDTPEHHLSNYKIYFEISILIVEIILGIHCYMHRKKRDFLLFLIPAVIYGMIVENSGITIGFFSEEGYLFYLPFLKAPLATMLGWASSFYITIFIVEKIVEAVPLFRRSGYITLSLLVSLSAVLIDLQLDPFAKIMGLWKWHPLLLNKNSFLIFGVPLLNFIAWFGAIFSFSVFYYFIMVKKNSYSQLKKTLILTALIPLILLFEAAVIFSLEGMINSFTGTGWKILINFLSG